MAGTDPINAAVTVDPAIEWRKEVQRLRSLFIRPHKVFLVTTFQPAQGEVAERWLSDSYVLVKVTGSIALKRSGFCYACDAEIDALDHEHDTDAPDGAYNLMASKGLALRGQDVLIPNTAGLLNALANRPDDWVPMERTQWSMADSEAKLMLAWADQDPDAFPVAVNEGIWQAFVDAYAGCPVTFEYLNEDTPYRVSCDCGVIGYIARAEFPKSMNEQAFVLVDWLVTHNEAA